MKARAVNRPSGKARRAPATFISPSCRPKRFSSSAWNSSSGSATMRSASSRLFRPHDGRALARQRQDRERPGRQEMLLGAAIVIALVRDRADDGRLVVIPAVGGDAGLLADVRARAVGADQQPRRNRVAVGQASRRCRSPRAQSRSPPCRADRCRALSPSRPAHRPAAGSRSCARTARPPRPRRRRSGRSAAPRRRAWNRSPPCRGSAAPRAATASQTSIASNSRRAAAAIAEARGSFDCAHCQRRVGDRHRKAFAQRPGAARSPAPGRQSPPRRSPRRALTAAAMRLPCKLRPSIAG